MISLITNHLATLILEEEYNLYPARNLGAKTTPNQCANSPPGQVYPVRPVRTENLKRRAATCACRKTRPRRVNPFPVTIARQLRRNQRALASRVLARILAPDFAGKQGQGKGPGGIALQVVCDDRVRCVRLGHEREVVNRCPGSEQADRRPS